MACFRGDWAVAGVLFLLGLIVAVRRFSAIVWSWCLFSLGIYLAAPFIWMWNPDYFFSSRFDYLALACLVGSLVLLAIRFACHSRAVAEGVPPLCGRRSHSGRFGPGKGKDGCGIEEGHQVQEGEFSVRPCGREAGGKVGQDRPEHCRAVQKPETADYLYDDSPAGLAAGRVSSFRRHGGGAGPRH